MQFLFEGQCLQDIFAMAVSLKTSQLCMTCRSCSRSGQRDSHLVEDTSNCACCMTHTSLWYSGWRNSYWLARFHSRLWLLCTSRQRSVSWIRERSTRRRRYTCFGKIKAQRRRTALLRRATSVIGMAPDVDPSTWDHSEIDKYGLGKVRPLDLFYRLFAIDVKKRAACSCAPL